MTPAITPEINPYNCTRPGNLFVGYAKMLKTIYRGFINGNSYAVLGGRRCGKTSLLIHMEKELAQFDSEPFKILPRRFSMQEMGGISPNFLFEEIYSLCVKDIDANTWVSKEESHAYRTFLNHMKIAAPALLEKHGPDWLVVLLIDELDNALHKLPDDLFFQNLRNLLMESAFNRHFRLIAAGVKDMAQLISSGASPLNNLRNQHLAVLKGKEAELLVDEGFGSEYDAATLKILFELTGRHPFLLQGVLEQLWEKKSVWTQSTITKGARRFLKQDKTFQRWAEAFGTPEQIVYNCLAAAPDGSRNTQDIKNSLPPALRPEVEDALSVLAYHGVIHDEDEEEPGIAGVLFRDWYLEKTQADILAIIVDLKLELGTMSLDEQTREKVEHELSKAAAEVQNPGSGKRPDRQTAGSILEKAMSNVKTTGDAAGTLTNFMIKFEKLYTFLGF